MSLSLTADPRALSPRMARGARRDGRDCSIIPIDLQPVRSSAHPDVVIDRPFWLEVVSVFQTLASPSPRRAQADLLAGSPSTPPNGGGPSRSPFSLDAKHLHISDEPLTTASVMIGTAPLTTENVAYLDTTSQLHRQLLLKYMAVVGLNPQATAQTGAVGSSPVNDEEIKAALPEPSLTTATYAPSSPLSSSTRQGAPTMSSPLALHHRGEVDVTTLQQILTAIGADCAASTVGALVKIIRYSTLDVRMLIRERSLSPGVTTAGVTTATDSSAAMSQRRPSSTSLVGEDGDDGTVLSSTNNHSRLSEGHVTKLLNAVATVIARRLVALRLFLYRGAHNTHNASNGASIDRNRFARDAEALDGDALGHRVGDESSPSLPRLDAALSAQDQPMREASSLLAVVEDVLANTATSSSLVLQRQRSDLAGTTTIGGSFSCRSSTVGGGGGSPRHRAVQRRALSPQISTTQSMSSRVGGGRSPPPSSHGGAASVASRALTPTRASLLRASPTVRTPPTDVNGRARRTTSPSASELLGPRVVSRTPPAVTTLGRNDMMTTQGSVAGGSSRSFRSQNGSPHPTTTPTVRRASSPALSATSAPLGFSAEHHQKHVAKAYGHVKSRLDCLHMSAVVHTDAENPYLSAPGGSGRGRSPVLAGRRGDGEGAHHPRVTPAASPASQVSPASRTLSPLQRRTSSPTLHHHSVLGGQQKDTSSSVQRGGAPVSQFRTTTPPPPAGRGAMRSLGTELSAARF